MNVELVLDSKKVMKAFDLTEKKLASLHKRAAKTTARNVRAISSKGNLGIEGLRRKKVPRAGVKEATSGYGVWFGLNPIRSSEFKIRPQGAKGGVTFQGTFYKGYFLSRFRYDKNPKSIKRAVRLPVGKRTWEELMVDIEREALDFIRSEIEPEIAVLFEKNLVQAVEKMKYVTKG